MAIAFTVFTKPWKMPIADLGPFVKSLGFAGVELPVRPGYPVNPENAATELPRAARTLGESGVKIVSVAGSTDEATIAACGEAGVPILRIMAPISKDSGYLEQETQLLRRYDALLPALERHHVTLGIQHHTGRYVTNAAGLRRLVERFDPRQVGAVWDPAHCALSGELPELAIDLLWSHLCLVNLKNGFWHRTNGPEAEVAQYGHYWTSGRQGQCSWPAVAGLLRQRGYQGYICLCAEYSDQEDVDRLIASDIAFARSLFPVGVAR
jgi:sugar phosphate isomerase/epimerase